jgi:signal transduction histidine kinase
MLTEHLQCHRQEVIRQVNLRADAVEEPRLAKGRGERIGALLDELIGTLQEEQQRERRAPWPRPTDRIPDELECLERDLVRREIIEEVARESPPLPLNELVTLSDWASSSDRSRLRERCRRLSELLDDVSESAMILTTDGRIEYLNRRAASYLHDATGIPLDHLVGNVPAGLVSPEKLVALARASTSAEEFLLGRWNETTYRAIYSPAGGVQSVAFTARDIHEPRLERTRLNLLSKLSATVGRVDYDNVADSLARVAIPHLADWCIVSLVENTRITRSAVARANPANAPLEEAAKRATAAWSKHPLWVEMELTTGFQLLSDVSDDLLRKLAANEENYRLLTSVGVRSIMVQPVMSRGKLIAIFTFLYTTESGRRYGSDHPALTAELALHAGHIIENARLLSDLRTTEARFRVAVAAAKTVVYENDASLRYRWWYNPLGLDSADVVMGKTVNESFSPEDAEIITALKRRALRGESVREEVSLTLSGARRQFREAVEPLRDGVNNVVGVIGAATDITEQKRVQERLGEALRFRDRMLAVLQHDLRNPLNAVTMAAAAALRQDLPDELRLKLQVIQKSADRMMEMIATLLDFTRAGIEGTLPIARSQADLGPSAQKVVEEAREAWPGRAIACETRGDLKGEWDRARIEEAMSNLVANALQHGDPRTPVRVSIDGTGEVVVLKVQNEGPPIPGDLIAVLFEPFSRGDAAPTGLGLGLFIVKQIATAHGGTVQVESNAEAGTTFTLLLARAA